ncbi:hypothetical protein D3C87_1651220 [compost metagenome]
MAKGSRASVNSQAEKVLKEIITNPGVKINSTNHFKHEKIIEYIAPSGQGARFSGDGKKFIGFLEDFVK